MTTYESSILVVSIITLVVLSLTLCFLIRYTNATNTLARTSVEQLPRPCVVLKQLADSSIKAVLTETTTSLPNEPLIFMNVGTGPAVNCRYHVRDTEKTGEAERSCRLPEIEPSGSFESLRVPNSLPENAVVSIEYESVAGSPYRTELVIEDRTWVRKAVFVSQFASEGMR